MEYISQGELNHDLSIFNELLQKECDVVVVTVQRRAKAVALPYHDLVIDGDSPLLARPRTSDFWKNNRSKLVNAVGEGKFIRITRHKKPYFCLTPPDWFFDQLRQIEACKGVR